MSDTDEELTQEAWYAYPGPEEDVILSTRVRLARNLADFVFPEFLKSEDAERVQSLVFDSFLHLENPDSFQSLRSSSLDSLGQRILSERGMFPYAMYSLPWTGGVIRNDGRVACSVNYCDHLRIASFCAGFNCTDSYWLSRSLDSRLQDSLQFAASSEFGYLTARMRDVGSGMKLTAVLHLPSLVVNRIHDKVFKEAQYDGCSVGGFFVPGDMGVPPGAYYVVQNRQSYKGDEQAQLRHFEQTVKRIVEYERGSAMNLLETKPTRVKDSVYRAIATIKYGRLVTNREGIELVSKIKWGVNLRLLSGIAHNELTALLYRIQNAHLMYVIRNGKFNFEQDIASEEVKIERLRSLVLQEALSHVQITA